MSDLELAFRKGVRDITAAQADGSSSVVLSVDRVNRGIDSLQSTLRDVGPGIGSVCSAIDSGFTELSYHMRMQSSQLKEILEVLQAPLDTQSKELRNRAQEAYANHWIDDAEHDFVKSIELNRYDFTLHQGLGNIAFFHRGDLASAKEHYERCAKYAGPKSPPDAAIAHISLTAVAEATGDLREAFSHAQQALKACSDLGESHYVVAKYASATSGNPEAVVTELIEAFRRRLVLTLLADRDPILGNRRELLDEALVRFRDELRADVKNRLDEFRNWQQTVALVLQQNKLRAEDIVKLDSKARDLERKCEELISLDSIFDLHEARHILLIGLPWFLRESSEAARLASSQLKADTRSARREAESRAADFRKTRIGFLVVGCGAGLVLALMLGTVECFIPLVILGGVGGLLANTLQTDRIARAYSDYSSKARALDNLSQELQSGLKELLHQRQHLQSDICFAPYPDSEETIYV